MPIESAPLARRGDSGVHYSPSEHGVRSVEQQVGEHLTQGARINRKIFTRTVACLDAYPLSMQPRLVEVDYRMQQPGHIGVRRPCRASKPGHGAMCNLRNAVDFFFSEHQVMATFVREGVFAFQKIEEVQ